MPLPSLARKLVHPLFPHGEGRAATYDNNINRNTNAPMGVSSLQVHLRESINNLTGAPQHRFI